MYYGNSGAIPAGEDPDRVWLSNYAMVQHLDETSGTHFDSTANDNDGSNNGSNQNATGYISGANTFDGSVDRFGILEDQIMALTYQLSFSALI